MIQLEDQRDDKLTSTVVKFQAHIRGYLARKNFKTRQVRESYNPYITVQCFYINTLPLKVLSFMLQIHNNYFFVFFAFNFYTNLKNKIVLNLLRAFNAATF